ncbi:MAG: transporter substrate-binding domain-containing protein [Hyphomicrobiales bacterium]|nr:MAG: transporter substrate-binding domain-containing protein [Hyphomicrobiales bacterium]
MRLCLALFLVLVSVSGVTAQSPQSILAPSGKLRVGVYPGSPTSMIEVPGGGERRGIAVEVGAELARRLGVEPELVILRRPAEVLEALKEGKADLALTNATPERAKIVDFGPPVVALELGFLVRAQARETTLAALDHPDVTIGVSKGSTSEKALPPRLPQAKFATAVSLDEAAGMLLRGDIAAFATNKAVLFEMADRHPGTVVLDASWGTEHLALAIPKGREAAHAYLEAFSRDATVAELIRGAASRAGLRGQAP